jgi:hypothetical protein
MGSKDRIEVRRDFKKIIGIFITFIGVLISGFGLWMLGLTIYSDILTATEKGIVYQPTIIKEIAIVGIGLIPLLVGIVIIGRASS